MTLPASPSAAAAVTDPYVGLTHFSEEEAGFFFGREEECGLIIGNLRAARLTLLYAESGVGKSSLLRAGVVARLRSAADRDLRSRGAPRLLPVVFSSWSGDPLAGLLRAIGAAAAPYLPEGEALELPEADLEGALEAVSGALEATVLVILDQFEEHFLYPDPAPAGRTVADQLAACVNRPDLRANFLISIREDSYARLGDLFRGRLSNVYGNFLHLDFLDRGGAREAIEKPVERVNELNPGEPPFAVEPELVEAVLDEVGRRRVEASDGETLDGGPRDRVETTYLQLVMRRLWEEETGAGSRLLRLATLSRLGGTEAIIGSHLDRAMGEGAEGESGLDQGQRRVAAAIFRFLVTSGGTKIALTARDLADLSGLAAAEIEPVLQHLSSPRLHILRPLAADDGGEARYEIFHDALARPIRDWRHRVEEAERSRERAEKEAAQEAAAEAERREERERKRKQLALAALGVALVALVVGAIAVAAHQTSVASQRESDTQSVRASDRIAKLAEQPSFGPAAAALASIEAYRLSPTTEAREQALAELQLNPALPHVVASHTRAVRAVAFWPGSGRFVSGGEDGTVRMWRAGGSPLRSPLVLSSSVESLAVSRRAADGTRTIAAGLLTGDVNLWKVDASGRVLAHSSFPAPAGTALGLAFDPRVPGLLAVGSPGHVELWKMRWPRRPKPVGGGSIEGDVNDLAFTPDARRLLVATTAGGFAWALSRAGLAAASPVPLDRRRAGAVAAAPNGSWAFGGAGWIDLRDAARRRTLRLHQPGRILSLAFARKGAVLVSGGSSRTVTTWDVASGRPFGPPRLDQGSVVDLATGPHETTVASASEDRLVKIWSLEPRHPLATTVAALGPGEAGGRAPQVLATAVGSERRLATADGSGGVAIWKVKGAPVENEVPHPRTWIRHYSGAVAYRGNLLAVGRRHQVELKDTGKGCATRWSRPCQLAVVPVPAERVTSVVMRKYGQQLLLAVSGIDRGGGAIAIWDITAAQRGEVERLKAFPPFPTEIFQLALSTQRPVLAAATGDGKLRVWNITEPRDPKGITPKHARTANENQPVYAVAFSPDGSVLAAGGDDQQVVLWRVSASGKKVAPTPGRLFQSEPISALAFSQNGKLLAAGEQDGSTCVYAIRSRDQIGSPTCLVGNYGLSGSAIRAVRFTRLGARGPSLLTAGLGQPVVAWDPILWNLGASGETEATIARDVCALAGRNLSESEWNAVFKATKLAEERHRTCPGYGLP